MDALHLCHLIVLCLWGGVVLAEAVVELVLSREDALVLAARAHLWIDLVAELPLLAGVLVTGGLLAARSWPPSPLLATKMAFGLAAVGINLYCAGMVVQRYARRDDLRAVRRYRGRILWSGLGIPMAGVAAYLGLTHYAGL